MAEVKDGLYEPLENSANSSAANGRLQNSGWDRVKNLYYSSNSYLYSNVSQAVGMGSITGFLIGGRFGARISGSEHMLAHQITVYSSKMQAHREYHSAVVKGFVKSGCRWGWRMGLFAGIYSGVLTVLQEYRDREDAINYVAAGAVTGATYKLFSGFRGIIVGTILGSCFSLPVALLAQGFFLLVPSEIKEKYHEIKSKERERQEKEWKQKATEVDCFVKKSQNELDSELMDSELKST